ncbi:Common plant regulatory factor [Trifolium repens]|nr:Common plant regulatory factor [Trifolium repens]
MASSNIFLLHHACFADAQSSQDAGQEKNNFLDDAQCPIGRRPRCFAQEFGDQIDSHVILRDPNHNEFEIHVTRKSKELYFDDGCFSKKVTFYDMYSGTLILPWVIESGEVYEVAAKLAVKAATEGVNADAPESRGLENSIANLADSLSSQPDSTAPAPVEVPGDRSDATLWNERELKRERRKQSNRESARRSRLRKQGEAEEFARKVESLNAESALLKSEVNQLAESSEKLRMENAALKARCIVMKLNQVLLLRRVVLENHGIHFRASLSFSGRRSLSRNFEQRLKVKEVELLCFVVNVTSRLDEQQGTQRTGNTSVDVVNVGGVRRIEMGLLSHVVGTNSTDQEEEHVQKQFQNKERLIMTTATMTALLYYTLNKKLQTQTTIDEDGDESGYFCFVERKCAQLGTSSVSSQLKRNGRMEIKALERL